MEGEEKSWRVKEDQTLKKQTEGVKGKGYETTNSV